MSRRGGGGGRKYQQGYRDLLNFSVGDDRPQQGNRQQSRKTATHHSSQGNGGKNSTKMTRQEEFVLSSYRLGVLETEPINPTIGSRAVPWERIQQIVTWESFEEYRCPICLDPPKCARITKCGHIFCLPCFLQYRECMHQDRKPVSCPLCQEAIGRVSSLRPVIMLPIRNHKVGDSIHLSLVRRERDSYLGFHGSDASHKHPPNSEQESSRFSRYFVLSREQVEVMYKRDIDELNRLIDAGVDAEEKEILLQAIESVKVGLQNALLVSDDIVSSSSSSSTASLQGEEPPHLFYQASDGQYLFLSGMNTRMLHHSASFILNSDPNDDVTFDFLPPYLEVKIEELDLYTQNEWSLKRFKNLAHLPLGTHFSIATVALKEAGVLDDRTVEAFDDQLLNRKKQRQAKLEREKEQEERRIRKQDLKDKERFLNTAIQLDGTEQYNGENRPVDLTDLESYPCLPGSHPLDGLLGVSSTDGVGTASMLFPQSPVDVGTGSQEVVSIPRRIDSTNGKPYTEEEFLECYGGYEEWEASVEATPLTQRKTISEIQAEEREAAQVAAATPVEVRSPATPWGVPSRAPAPRVFSSSSVASPTTPSVIDNALQQKGNKRRGKRGKGTTISLNTGAVL
eukprot:TRINITY_DN16683_c0_g1_i1.p1 TRINITY_DN16683_c0_g1~~TRINITY_DN16683_c0_g1_i1.p1  ORF type:complete len:624 (+),score=103.75 TRINITY_DN16683_c0_g1_i1:204-2075(+)